MFWQFYKSSRKTYDNYYNVLFIKINFRFLIFPSFTIRGSSFIRNEFLKNIKVMNEKETEGGNVDAKPPRKRPNFFLAFPVDNVEIHKKVRKLQEEIVNRNPALHAGLVNVVTLHITLGVTHLKDDNDIQSLKEKLNIWECENKDLFFNEPVILRFTGTGTFENKVAYIDMEKCENYQKVCKLSNHLNELLKSAGFSVENRPVTPHLTILKLSKSHNLYRKKKKFKEDFKIIKECSDHFGTQNIKRIQLLSMDEPKCENGYYKCLHEILIIKNEENENDHSECCEPIPQPNKKDDELNEEAEERLNEEKKL